MSHLISSLGDYIVDHILYSNQVTERLSVLEMALEGCVSRLQAKFDHVISNPPYVKTGCISRLQPEISRYIDNLEITLCRRQSRALSHKEPVGKNYNYCITPFFQSIKDMRVTLL